VRIDMVCGQPRRDPLRNKLRTMVTLHIFWGAPVGKQPLESDFSDT
jgi:hypothetical protein